jgi:hypothetical protein
MCIVSAMNQHKNNIRVGVIGAGTMGRHHVRVCANSPDVSFQGFYDPDIKRAQDTCALHGCIAREDLEELLGLCDAVIIAAPTYLHREIGQKALESGIHAFIEKPLSDSPANATALVDLAYAKGLVLMVGHIERYNPAICSLMNEIRTSGEKIVSIGARRLAPFDGDRCMDMDVLYDLLIHDIDLALEIASSPVKRVSASGQTVYSKITDSVQALLEFENGASAALWAARCSPQKVREITVTTEGHFFNADTLNKTLFSCKAPKIPDMEHGECVMGVGEGLSTPLEEFEPLKAELEDFFRAIREDKTPVTHGKRALDAMKVLELAAASMATGSAIMAEHCNPSVIGGREE